MEFEGYIRHPPEHRGTARILEKGFDTDAMKRYAVFIFEPALKDGRKVLYKLYSAVEVDENEAMPTPMTDDMETRCLRTFCKAIGYDLVVPEE